MKFVKQKIDQINQMIQAKIDAPDLQQDWQEMSDVLALINAACFSQEEGKALQQELMKTADLLVLLEHKILQEKELLLQSIHQLAQRQAAQEAYLKFTDKKVFN